MTDIYGRRRLSFGPGQKQQQKKMAQTTRYSIQLFSACSAPVKWPRRTWKIIFLGLFMYTHIHVFFLVAVRGFLGFVRSGGDKGNDNAVEHLHWPPSTKFIMGSLIYGPISTSNSNGNLCRHFSIHHWQKLANSIQFNGQQSS